jgi:hypothetical protein
MDTVEVLRTGPAPTRSALVGIERVPATPSLFCSSMAFVPSMNTA